VLIHSVCSYLVSGQITNNGNIFLTILETGKPRIKAPADSMSSEGPFPDSWIAVSLLGGVESNLFTVYLKRELIPFPKSPPL
jgi:hypothetical protein